MANEQNLIPQNKRTKNEQREIAKKGGKASGKSRRRKKYIKEQLEALMLLDLQECKLKDDMRNWGIVEEEMTIQNAMLCSLVQQALHGNIKAFQLIRDQLLQNPKEDTVEPLQNIIFLNDLSRSKLKKEEEK